MIQGTFRSKSDQKDGGENTIHEKQEAVVEKMITEFQENSRKLEKMKSLLYTAGNVEVGNTPYEVVKETRTYRLAHYYPLASRLSKTPILLVYALINKSYILDLQPDKSWVRNLLRQGFDLYLIDWKTPTNVDKFTSFDDFINCYMDDCVEIVRKENSVDKITLHGYCMGATMSVLYASLYQEKVRNLATIAPVIDASKDTTVIGNFCKHIDIDKIYNSVGNLPPEQLYACYSALKPFKQGVNKYFNLAENIDNDQFVQNFLRIEKWLYDTPPIAGETIRQWIKDIYQNNRLMRNEMKIGNDTIDLTEIKIPVLNIVAEEDHLVSSECSVPLNDIISSTDKRLMRFHTGHVGLIASTYSQNNVLPKVGQWLRSRSQ
jgi:polyhydroxyalkanoate synthase subunit PhaC